MSFFHGTSIIVNDMNYAREMIQAIPIQPTIAAIDACNDNHFTSFLGFFRLFSYMYIKNMLEFFSQ